MTDLRRRCIHLGDRSTSIYLELATWREVSSIARARDCTLQRLVTDIDRDRGDLRLAAAIRAYVEKIVRRKHQQTRCDVVFSRRRSDPAGLPRPSGTITPDGRELVGDR